MKSQILKGSSFIVLGAICYGMLGTFVKMAYHDGFNIAEVTISQFTIGFAVLLLLTLLKKTASVKGNNTTGIKSQLKLVVAGTSLGLTGVFYYQSVQYIPVSVAIVLLIQTVWMGVLVEMIIHRKMPGFRKIIAVVIILAGTILATNLFEQSINVNWIGFGWGLMAALSYTATMYSSNKLELHLPPLKRSLFMILGGLIIILIIFHASLNQHFSFGIFLSWGLVVSLFGTVLPPLLFTKGMAITGIGLGAIIASIEIPVSVFMAHLLLKEPVSLLQWRGVMLILFAVVLMNIPKRRVIYS
ncbi:DMT family transporter [Mucilaginibacter sp.]|uniref:DMT family transporter n=1 Tax=Mucilaginibacter sp. TaxID=1882438 RepID=UPI002607F59D|nr:DMT family transporter [Mucilaginibacter sp.]MDB4921580.1 permease [Mucilaginibacter sp.]